MKPVYFCICQNRPKLERCGGHCKCDAVFNATNKAWRGQRKKALNHLRSLVELDPKKADTEAPKVQELLTTIDERIEQNNNGENDE